MGILPERTDVVTTCLGRDRSAGKGSVQICRGKRGDGHPFPYAIEQLKHSKAGRIGNHFQSIDRRIRLSSLYLAWMRLVEADRKSNIWQSENPVKFRFWPIRGNQHGAALSNP